MHNKRFPYALVLVAFVIMLLYPRVLPAGAPGVLRTDFAVGLVYGACVGLEILALVILKRQRENHRHGS